MPRKVPYSGKQKKQQLQERKARKKDGPRYLADWSDGNDDDEDEYKSASMSEKNDASRGAAAERAPSTKDIQKMNSQPERQSRVSVNSFRLHFLKEPDEVIEKRKKEARKAVKQRSESEMEYSLVDAYPTHFNLDFPKRPTWNYSISKEQLEKQEKEYFQMYLQTMLSQPQAHDLSFFELNLENWRQMWRVVEMADILLLVVDIRYPVLHISPSLIHHVQRDLHKPVILVINKIDLVPPAITIAWKQYILAQFPGVRIVFFSSCVKKIRGQEKKKKEGGDDDNDDKKDKGDERDDNDEDDDGGGSSMNFDPSKTMFKRPAKGSTVSMGPADLFEVVREIVKDEVDLSDWRHCLEQEGEFPMSESGSGYCDGGGGSPNKDIGASAGGDGGVQESPRYKDGVVTLGCIGYPNAGKSSVLNSLKGKKVVSVSQTPGHTKHLQTIFLTPTVKLCDCPGLVFPSVVSKSLQVIAGIFPVSQVREPYSVVQFLAEHMDLPGLLRLRRLPDCTQEDYRWSAFDICEAWALKCGFVTPKAARPDLYRAANNILRLAVSGQIRLCFRPPGYSSHLDTLMSDMETLRLGRRLKTVARQNATDGGAGNSDDDDDDDDDEEDGRVEDKLEEKEEDDNKVE